MAKKKKVEILGYLDPALKKRLKIKLMLNNKSFTGWLEERALDYLRCPKLKDKSR